MIEKTPIKQDFEESYIEFNKNLVFLRSRISCKNRPTILFVHGRGDSGLSYESFFRNPELSEFDIIIPDLAGYGRSSSSSEYSYYHQVKQLIKLIDQYNLNNIVVIGHCMGGNIATLLLNKLRDERLTCFINVEGNLTKHDISFSARAVEAAEQSDYNNWFRNELLEDIVLKGLGRRYSGRLYYQSLGFARPAAFLENAREIIEYFNPADKAEKKGIGDLYVRLDVPHIFCYGNESLSAETVQFLTENDQEVRLFEGAGHFPHIDNMEEFNSFCLEYIRRYFPG